MDWCHAGGFVGVSATGANGVRIPSSPLQNRPTPTNWSRITTDDDNDTRYHHVSGMDVIITERDGIYVITLENAEDAQGSLPHETADGAHQTAFSIMNTVGMLTAVADESKN